MRRRIVFHIGLAKTGTTSIQHFCHDNRAALKRSGVLYPRHQLGRGLNHSPLVAGYLVDRPVDRTIAVRHAPRAVAVRSLLKEIEASDCPTVLISSEHFSTHFDRREACQLAEDFGGHDLEAVVAVRDHHARFLSSYNTHVTAAGSLPMDRYAASMLIPGTRFMSAREVACIWREAFGGERVKVLDYDAETDICQALLRECGIASRLKGTNTYRDRVSLGPDAIRLLRATNALIVERQGQASDRGLPRLLQLWLFTMICQRHLKRHPTKARGGTWSLPRATVDALDLFAEEDRAYFANTYGLDLKGKAGRARIAIADDAEATGEEASLRREAEALLQAATRGLRAPTDVLVDLCERVTARRTRPDTA